MAAGRWTQEQAVSQISTSAVFGQQYEVQLLAHLAMSVPQQPYIIDDFVEADWGGYQPAAIGSARLITAGPALFRLSALAWFNLTNEVQIPQAMWIDGIYQGTKYFFGLIPLPSNGYQIISPGGNSWEINAVILTGGN